MKALTVKRMVVFVVVMVFCVWTFVIIAGQLQFDKAAFKDAVKQYENNDDAKALPLLKKMLAGTFSSPASPAITSAGQDEKKLRSLFDSENDAAHARYILALKYEKQGKISDAAVLLRNCLEVISSEGAKYVGTKKCKKCHLKEYMSWKKTKMAGTFNVLKSGANVEAKKSSNLSPDKDYSKDASCLPCHTAGYELVGGYKSGDPARSGKDFEGVTCEGCHGPGSKYIKLHEEIAKTKRSYDVSEHYNAGGSEMTSAACTNCHNRRNPTTGPDFVFDYEKYKTEGIHKISPLKYRKK
jgi:hypothetical protein